jgi:FkbM family methyltransferase
MDFSIYCQDDIRILEKLKEGGFDPRIIYDIGASNGFWSAAIAPLFPRSQFHLFEPAVDLVPEYKPYMDQNLAAHPNFTLHPFALGDTNGTIKICLSPGGFGNTTLDVGTSTYFPTNAQVPIKTLDAAVKELKLPAPQLIKIDVQATEDKILRGAIQTLPAAEVVEIECWTRKGYGTDTPLMSQITEFMEAHSFNLVETGYAYYSEERKLEAIDCFFLRDDLCKKWKTTLPPQPWR